MLHTIENDNLICTIDSNGAEIRSLKDKTTGKEYIWQINTSIWGSSSPILFPAIGKIKADKIMYNNTDYAMTKHGIIRNNDTLSFQQNNISECTFTLNSSSETFKKYPYAFTFSVTFTLIEKRLIMNYTIKNRDITPMQFACGGHTAYACPLSENTKLSDYVIEFPTQFPLKSSTLGDNGLLSQHTRDIETNKGVLALSDTLFNDDALIFPNIECNWVRLRKKDNKKGVVVTFKGYPNLALWSKPKADYVCIEPWLGLPDSEDESVQITEKTTYKTIEPDTKFSIAIETEIE